MCTHAYANGGFFTSVKHHNPQRYCSLLTFTATANVLDDTRRILTELKSVMAKDEATYRINLFPSLAKLEKARQEYQRAPTSPEENEVDLQEVCDGIVAVAEEWAISHQKRVRSVDCRSSKDDGTFKFAWETFLQVSLVLKCQSLVSNDCRASDFLCNPINVTATWPPNHPPHKTDDILNVYRFTTTLIVARGIKTGLVSQKNQKNRILNCLMESLVYLGMIPQTCTVDCSCMDQSKIHSYDLIFSDSPIQPWFLSLQWGQSWIGRNWDDVRLVGRRLGGQLQWRLLNWKENRKPCNH